MATIQDCEKEADCHLILDIKGNHRDIARALANILTDMAGDYKKPLQGIISCGCCTTSIITPIWDGKKL